MLATRELAMQVTSADVRDLLEDDAKADETLLYVEDDELAGLLWERIGNADIEEAPQIEEVIVYRCVMAKGVWL